MKTNKDFDCVIMMREIRKMVSAEIEKMNSVQIMDYFKSKSAEFEKSYGKPLKKPNQSA